MDKAIYTEKDVIDRVATCLKDNNMKIGTKLLDTNDALSELMGTDKELVGFAIAVRGKKSQSVIWLKSKNFMEDDE